MSDVPFTQRFPWTCGGRPFRGVFVWIAGLLLIPAFASVNTISLLTSPVFAEEISFNRDIRPILSDACFKCHGPDAAERQAGLRLDLAEGATSMLESGTTAIVPGNESGSELLARVTSTDPDIAMPPASTGRQLTAEQMDLLRRWIQQGAEYQGHWAFIAPAAPATPEPVDGSWRVNPIDDFVLARLRQEGLNPSPEADRSTLIRRLTLDLTGLPPTPAEVSAFLHDQHPAALENLVDRLLGSERYGEHMARHWLDLVRYGDSHGLHLDNERSLWKYRDWVISAFNGNMPFDQFTIEQLAGDLLPEATIDQKIATGFNRCNVTTSEGGSINEEVLVRYAVDRTETMSTIFMGMTLGCAVCHDHKFDPVSQKEFYQLYAFYNAAADAAMDGNQLAPPPTIKVPSEQQTAQLAALDQQLAEVGERIEQAMKAVEYTDPGPQPQQSADEPVEIVWIEDETPPGAQQQGDSAWEFVSAPEHPVYSGTRSTRRLATGVNQHFFTGAAPTLRIGSGDVLFAWCWLDPENPPATVMLQFNDGSWEHRAYWGADRIPFGSGDGPSHRPMGELPATGEWVKLEVAAADVGLQPGAELNGWAFTQCDGLMYWDHAGLRTRTPQQNRSYESQQEWEAFELTQEKSSVPQAVRDAIRVALDQRTAEQSEQIRAYFLQSIHPVIRRTFEPLLVERTELTKQRTDTDNAIPITMIMADLAEPRETFVLRRGEYNLPGEKVEPDVPSIFPHLPADAPRNRLGLARWLVDPSHPLTARVTVNRIWQQLFGNGIVRTSEDFGSQGQWPSHPELLDWLAVDFIQSGWDVKRLQKQIVMSRTWRQSSRLTPELLAKDPDNELLARGPRYRLDAEVVRDSALAVSGLLVEHVGGRSVRPYQPPGLWEAVAFVGSTTQFYKRDDGDALFRRSLYTFWKRTSPPPSLMAFDAPSRENCISRRARTNTPLQALVLMNDEQYVEASRKLGERMLKEAGSADTDRLTLGFQLCTGRPPADSELSVLRQVLEDHRRHYQAHEDAALKLLTIGTAPRDETLDPVEHAALTMMGNLLLNLDETITRE